MATMCLRVQEPFTAESAESAELFGVFRALGGLGGERLWAPDRTLRGVHRAHRVIVLRPAQDDPEPCRGVVPIVIDS